VGRDWLAAKRLGLIVCAALILSGTPASSALAAGRPAHGAGLSARVARLGSAPAASKLSLVLPLKANTSGLERFANAVTTVGSPMYGDYEPIRTLARRFGASGANRARVVSYLRHAGATDVKVDVTGLFADAKMSVASAQHLFGTSLGRYQTARSSHFIAPTSAAHVPAALNGAVTGVVGLDTRPVFTAPESGAAGGNQTGGAFPHPAATFSKSASPSGYLNRTGTASGCAAAIADRGFTPNQYLTAYDYAGLQAAGITGRGERVALIEIDGFSYSDLRTFASCFHNSIPAIKGYGVGIRHALAPGGETTLDLEVLDAAAPGLKEIDVYESDPRASDVLQSLTAPLRNANHVPEVISASLGTCEPAVALSIGKSGARAAEGALALAAASGISVLASSGDAGSSACIASNGPIDHLAVSYPASSPFVTGVGGTNVQLNSANKITAQPVWNDAPLDISGGGGGVSGLFTRPTYQQGFVSPNRRAVPDVSMLADVAPGYNIYCTAKECLQGSSTPWITVGGTSAAAPLFAGGLALVDQVLRQHHKQDVGLANSLLYTAAKRFASTGVISDVITGNNDLGALLPSGDHRPLGCCAAGPGFDFASGLGSVDIGRLALISTSVEPAIAHVHLSLPRQRPIRRGRMLATLGCSGRCVAEAVAKVSIKGSRPILVRSPELVFSRKGHHTVAMPFSKRSLPRLRRAVRRHKKISATVVGEIVDSGGNVEARTGAQTLRIHG
jgi:subtilase family serine protease